MQILKLKPVFKDYIWGGKRLKDDFGFDTGYEKTAEKEHKNVGLIKRNVTLQKRYVTQKKRIKKKIL